MRSDTDGPAKYDDNVFWKQFTELASEMRRKDPERFRTTFDAEAHLAQLRPSLYSAAWAKKWSDIFIFGVQDLEDSQGMALDKAYATVERLCPAAAKSISLNQCRRW